MPEGWHERLGDIVLADSILDRIVPSSYTMRIDGDVSMRQRQRIIKLYQIYSYKKPLQGIYISSHSGFSSPIHLC